MASRARDVNLIVPGALLLAVVLGLLAETLGEQDRALAHYTDALAFEEQCQAETLAARTRQALARIS